MYEGFFFIYRGKYCFTFKKGRALFDTFNCRFVKHSLRRLWRDVFLQKAYGCPADAWKRRDECLYEAEEDETERSSLNIESPRASSTSHVGILDTESKDQDWSRGLICNCVPPLSRGRYLGGNHTVLGRRGGSKWELPPCSSENRGLLSVRSPISVSLWVVLQWDPEFGWEEPVIYK